MTSLSLRLPLRLVSELNQREHHMVRSRRAAEQRMLTRVVVTSRLIAHAWPIPPVVVTLTRVAVRMMDDDNLAGSFKHVRDEIAAILGIDDRDVERLRFVCAQRKAAATMRTNEVEVEIAAEQWGARRLEARR